MLWRLAVKGVKKRPDAYLLLFAILLLSTPLLTVHVHFKIVKNVYGNQKNEESKAGELTRLWQNIL